MRRDGSKNLFILGGGTLQLLNALEAANHFLSDSEEAVLLLSKTLRKFESLVERRDWLNVHWIDRVTDLVSLSHPSRLFALRRHTKAIRKLLRPLRGSCNYLFLGHYNEFNREVARWLNPREVVFIGDGIGDLATSEVRERELRSTTGMNLRQKLRCRLYGWKPEQVHPMVFFTSLPVILSSEDRQVPNEYDFLKKQFGLTERTARDVVAFAGQPLYLPDYGFTDYWELLRDFLVPEVQLEYWCHPKERPEIVESHIGGANVRVRQSSLPLEVEFLQTGFPKVLMSYCSSTLVTSHQIFGSLGLKSRFVRAGPSQEKQWNEIRNVFRLLGVKPMGPL